MTSSNISTPLATLLAMLRSEGFDISTSTLIDLQKVLANLKYEQVSDFSELRSLIGPLISRNKEEQEHFNAVFTKYEEYIAANSFAVYEEPKNEIYTKKRRWVIQIVLACILALAAIAYFVFTPSPERPPAITVEKKLKDSLDYALTGEPVLFQAMLKDTVAKEIYHVSFRIDDTLYSNTRKLEKIFYSQGTKSLQVFVLNRNNDTLNSYSDNIAVYCEKPPAVAIIKDPKSSASKRHYTLQFTNAPDTTKYTYRWFINDSLAGDARDLDTSIKTGKSYAIRVDVETKDAFKCTDSLTATFNERPTYSLSLSGIQPLDLTADVNWKKIVIAGLYSILLPLTVAIFVLFYKRKKAKLPAQQVSTDAPIEYTGPYKIEFKDQAEKISPEKEISQLAEAMRKRHVSDQLFLNVPKTIAATIRSGGFPYLQFSSRTQPTDFLVFVDKENPDGLQVKLFEFVLGRLETEQVNIIPYAFYREPLLLSNDKLNQRMLPVDKVARLYPNTILFIFSDTREFFEAFSTKLKPWVTEKFKAWDHKLIITPVPVNDWDYKENALSKEGFTVVPADLNAHHLIANEINNLINRQKIQYAAIPSSYSSRFVNFDNWPEVKKYIGDNERLLQWIAALAVYPYIDWKATVAIGKAMEDKGESNNKLVTYTNLLKLSRIKWMQTGLIPDALRLEMLSHLDNESEVKARNVMVKLFQEVEENITATSMIADEFELNKTVNKFLLHTRNPTKHALSAEEHEKMKSYVENQWLDQPLEQYLDKAENTLLKDDGGDKSISPSEYFKAEGVAEIKKRNTQRTIRRLAAAAALLAGIFLTYNFFSNDAKYKIPKQYADITFNLIKNTTVSGFKNSTLSVTANNKIYSGSILSDSSFVVKDVPIDIAQQVMINLATDSLGNFEQELALHSQQYTISIMPPRQPSPLYIRYNDAASFASIEQQLQSAFTDFDITSSQASFTDSSRIEYHDASQKPRADSVVKIIKDNLGINVNTQLKNAPGQSAPVLFLNLAGNQCATITALPSSLNEIWSGGTSNRLINILPSKKLIYYSTGDKKTYGTYRIEEICLNPDGLYRIITNAGNGYQDFLLRNVKPSSFELSICQNRYSSLQEARAVNESYCDHFNEMKVYYENDNKKAFLNQSGDMLPSQLYKLKKLTNDVNANSYNALWFKNSLISSVATLGSIKAAIGNSLNKSSLTYIENKFRGTPFDRDYLNIEANGVSQPLAPDCNRTFTSLKEALSVNVGIICRLNLAKQNLTVIPSEIYQFKNLRYLDLRGNKIPEGDINKLKVAFPKLSLQYDQESTQSQEVLLKRINLDAKGYPDAEAQAALKQIVEYMAGYSNTSVRIVLYYSDDYSQKEAGSFRNTIENYLSGFKYNKSQVKFELRANAAQQVQQQQQKLPQLNARSKTNGYDQAPRYADVYGTGFPQGFSASLQSKASAY